MSTEILRKKTFVEPYGSTHPSPFRKCEAFDKTLI